MPIDPNLTSWELEHMRSMLVAWRRNEQAVAPSFTGFTVVSPLGLAQREALIAVFGRYGIVPVGRRSIPYWPRLATFLYAKTLTETALARAVLFERVWSRFDTRAELWLLAAQDYRDLSVWKHEMRRQLVEVAEVVSTERGDFPVTLHPFHVPDAAQLGAEAQTVSAYLNPSSCLCEANRGPGTFAP